MQYSTEEVLEESDDPRAYFEETITTMATCRGLGIAYLDHEHLICKLCMCSQLCDGSVADLVACLRTGTKTPVMISSSLIMIVMGEA
ncbi:uncharacterized protein LOC126325508 isoform X2 [Schistocerca gregaria]|nr:uncharacterized protein LOC126325508 isoform X2 [Schistocerca gregaria]